jgi:hypothetical protein
MLQEIARKNDIQRLVHQGPFVRAILLKKFCEISDPLAAIWIQIHCVLRGSVNIPRKFAPSRTQIKDGMMRFDIF